MKKFGIITFTLFSLLNCSKQDNSGPIQSVESISSNRTFIGDTLTIIGQNLESVSNIKLEYYKTSNSIQNTTIILKTEREIKFVIPEVYDESLRVYVGSNDITFDIEIFGYIPFNARRVYIDPSKKMSTGQVVNDDLAFFIPENNGFFKGTERYTNLESVDFFNNKKVVKCYFFDINKGWVITNEEVDAVFSNFKFYFTQDGGATFSLKNTISSNSLDGGIYSIGYSQENSGYIQTWRGSFYKITDTSIENIKTAYPNLTTVTDYDDGVYYNYKILNNGALLLFSEAEYLGVKSIIRIEDNVVSYMPTENIVKNITFFDNKGYYYTNNKVYESVDYGLTWKELSNLGDWSSNLEYEFLQVLSTSQFLRRKFYNNRTSIPARYELSLDQGKTWKKCLHLPWENVKISHLSQNYGLAAGDRRGFLFRKFLE